MNDKTDIVQRLKAELGLKNPMALPRLTTIVLNMGLKDALKDEKLLQEAVLELSLVAGQRPVVTKAKKAIASFKLRQGDAIGMMVTLRGKRMYDFFAKLVSIVLPRLRDFHGVKTTSFDGNGNYSIGLSDISVFPEVDASSTRRTFGIEVTIKTTAKKDEEARKLLELLGMPFKKYG